MYECLCDQCAALCCRYFALPLDNPRTRRDYDDIRWYLCHENVVVFIEKKQWYIGILNRCKHLMPDNRCAIYQTRPRICREYSTDNCDYHGGEYDFDVLFTSAEQLWQYALEKLKEQRQKKRRKTKSAKDTPARNSPAKRRRPLAHPSARPRSRRKGGRSGQKPEPVWHENGNGRMLSLPLLR